MFNENLLSIFLIAFSPCIFRKEKINCITSVNLCSVPDTPVSKETHLNTECEFSFLYSIRIQQNIIYDFNPTIFWRKL